MRTTYEHVATTLNRFAALARADAVSETASKAATMLTANGVRKDNGKEYTGHDVRMFRVVNKDISEAQRAALIQAHLSLLGSHS